MNCTGSWTAGRLPMIRRGKRLRRSRCRKARAPGAARENTGHTCEVVMAHTDVGWRVFDSFPARPSRAPIVPSVGWPSNVSDWVESVRQIAATEAADIQPLLARWDLALEPLGGDPNRTDWSNFRP